MQGIFKRESAFFDCFGGRNKNEWSSTFPRISLDYFNTILTRDLPFDTRLLVELKGGKRSQSDLRGTIGLERPVFMLEGLYIYQSATDPLQSFLGVNEVRIDPDNRYPEYKGAGLGKIIISNCVALAYMLGISKIRLTAGRENGALFWARHGFNIEMQTGFMRAEDNYKQMKERLPKDVQHEIEAVFTQAREDKEQGKISSANRALASLTAVLDGVPVREILYKGVEYRAILDLNDEEQLAAFKQSMRNIDAIRWDVQKAVEDKKAMLPHARQHDIQTNKPRRFAPNTKYHI